ncbi:uncharacterized protein DEA37_0010911 [Paragonimus westermani]|uniref:Negative elongation factor E n=1 Tax=Paragonimus westermani TaxID=34504 RepID=A0A5J4NJ97_9TREM|nr:uncharacterized protein DEA37_0010911 [Paragonimus westermani]
MSVTMTFDEPVHELGKIVDTEELLANFIIDMPRDLTDSEKALKKELISLRKMRRTLTELCQIRKEEKPRAPVKTGEKAKEEAMELLRSGAIQIADKKDRHTFKRKPKEVDDEESISRTVRICFCVRFTSLTQFTKPVELDKRAPYSNFLRGPKLMPQCSEVQEAQSVDLKEGKPSRSLDFERDHDGSCTLSSNLELAASKRKQQLLALSEEETEEEEQNVESSIPPESQTDHSSDNMGDSSYSCPSLETTLHVGYHQVTTDFIHEMFEPLGRIVRVKINDYQNHAYVTMATREMAKKALEVRFPLELVLILSSLIIKWSIIDFCALVLRENSFHVRDVIHGQLDHFRRNSVLVSLLPFY